jgi:putative ABC transport system permease protein
MIRGRLLLALRHAQHHRARTLVLVGCIALALFVPLVASVLMARYERELGARAAATPLLVGARGNRFDLALNALYFRQAELEPVPWSEYERLAAEGRGVCIPLHVGCTARGRALVATTAEYAELRELALASGTDPLRIGEATLGATAAHELGLGVGDTLYTDQVESYDIARPPALRLRVVGVYTRRGTPDDGAVFVDVKTAWAVLGIAHGHVDVSTVDETLVVSRAPGSVQLSGAVIEHAELDDETIASFHLHAGPAALPLSAVIVVPFSAKDGTLLCTEVNTGRTYQALVPSDVVADLLGVVFRVKRFFDLVGVVLGVTTAVLVALVFVLSSRLRAAEMRTLDHIGAPRSTALALHGLELAAVLALAALAALAAVGATLALLPNLVTAI